ncbi:retrotransposon gag protein [Cucumis melo var. makuwa]|uniref:Retrotransposon gag protein n=1 Tax=Cucumis melo var. makuwa TaxID=1194695 RepID=A0A5D3DUE4_CUCMM|nr:retrotransposon gag protein [Cucumis melo var. makuwa]
MESSKSEIVISLFDNSTLSFDLLGKESHLEVVSVMMTNVTTETTMVKLKSKINLVMKAVEERDHEIAALSDHMKTCEISESS